LRRGGRKLIYKKKKKKNRLSNYKNIKTTSTKKNNILTKFSNFEIRAQKREEEAEN